MRPPPVQVESKDLIQVEAGPLGVPGVSSIAGAPDVDKYKQSRDSRPSHYGRRRRGSRTAGSEKLLFTNYLRTLGTDVQIDQCVISAVT